MENSSIEWTDHTFNPWLGCQKVSPGCDHCYAETIMDKRFHRVEWGPRGERVLDSDAYWTAPLRWNANAKATGKRPKVFCASSADWLDNKVPQEWRVRLGDLIRGTPDLDWLLLTKRIENYDRLAPWRGFLPNVWLGVTCESQPYFDRRWPILSDISAVIHFVSYEPALGPLSVVTPVHGFPDWIICGGETGKDARYMKPEWARGLRDECQEYGISFFMKQMTLKAEIPRDLLVRNFPILDECFAEA
jgi:protein gp37